jgi:polar amino acid transport system substrate-binding protein
LLLLKRLLVLKTCVVILLLSCVTAEANAADEQKTVLRYNISASNSWYPYYIAKAPERPGILGELIPQILSLAEIASEVHHFPPKRTNQALDSGLLDFDVVSPSWFETGEVGDNFMLSAPIMTIVEYIVVLEKNKSLWSISENIKGRSIGTVMGYAYHDDDNYTRVDFKSERELIMALHKERVEAIISGELTALFWAKELNLPISLAIEHSSGDLVIRLRKEHNSLLPSINSAIQTLKQSGEIQRVIDKYTQNMAP